MTERPHRYSVRFCGVCQLPLHDCHCVPTALYDAAEPPVEDHEMIHAVHYDDLLATLASRDK